MAIRFPPQLMPRIQDPAEVAYRIALSWAKRSIREEGSNRGRWVDAIIEVGGGDAQEAPSWCAYTVSAAWLLGGDATGTRLTTEPSGGVVRLWQKNPTGRIPIEDIRSGKSTLRRGDAILRVRDAKDLARVHDGRSALGHVELCEGTILDGWVHTVGGNTNDGDAAEGDGVYEKVRGMRLDDPRLIGIVRPTYVSL